MRAQNQKLWLAVAICMAFLSVQVFAQGGPPPGSQPGDPYQNQGDQYQGGGDPPGRVARLGYLSGTVSFQPSGEDQWSQAVMNYPLTTGDRVYTDRDGRAELETGNIAVRLSATTDLTTTNLSDQLVQLGLAQGTLRVRAYDIMQGNSVEIDTPNAALTLLRPGSYRVEAYPDDNTTLVTVNSGDLEISGNGFSQTIHSGQSVKLSGQDEVQMADVSNPGSDDFDRWCNDRDRRFTSSASRQYVGPYVPGYEDLDQYGQWQPTPDYGQVWYPAQVPVGWAPYRYGRWAWVEPWGWTWVEDEPWGFAPFHYGRWALIGSRWGWVPGEAVAIRPVYAPALVAFVGGPSAGVQVWFPLGPRDPYFPWYHHSDVYLRQVNVTNVRVNVNIVNVINVRNVENIHYAYQRVAPTAVSTEVFRGGRPVARETVRVDAEAIGRARVIAHPDVHPDVRAVHAGAPETHPAVERTRPRVESRAPVYNGNNGNRPGAAPRGNENRPVQEQTRPAEVGRTPANGGNNPPATNRGSFDNRGNTENRSNVENRGNVENHGNDNRGNVENRGTPDNRGNVENRGNVDNRNLENRGNPPNRENPQAPPAARENNPSGPPTRGNNPSGPPTARENTQNNNPAGQNRGNGSPSGPPTDRRPLVTRNPAPQQNPSFSQRQGAMQEHPGRPLEPQQVDNIRRGQPAGPMHDSEPAPHNNQANQPRENNSGASHNSGSSSQHGNESRGGKEKDDKKPR
ncbi:MAG TPA: DUF6600 domain-containing protein [Candidatus Angelobacter sp.]|nr:DUF6600 domain-containing protein [Candidatus Angelobacter sp.]